MCYLLFAEAANFQSSRTASSAVPTAAASRAACAEAAYLNTVSGRA
jgi:hypothetical protein